MVMDEDLVTYDPIEQVGDRLYIRDGRGDRTVVTFISGTPASFNAGWRARLLYNHFAPLLLLELEHSGGARATWYLDAAFCRLGDSVKELPMWDRDHLKLASAALSSPDPSPAEAARADAFWTLNPKTRAEILALHSGEFRPDTMATLPDLGPQPGALTLVKHIEIVDPAALNFGLPYRPLHAKLRLNIAAADQPKILNVLVNGWHIGRIDLAFGKNFGASLEYWIPREAIGLDHLSITFDTIQAARSEPANYHMWRFPRMPVFS
jgi:hypothetical protein